MRSVAIIGAILAVGTLGKWNSCGPSDYKEWTQSFMQGFQKDTTSTDTDCYEKTTVLVGKEENFFKSFTEWNTDDWAGPVYKASELAVATTDLFTYCETTNFAKQFAVRTNSLGGFFDLLATIGVAFFKEYRDPGSTDN